MPQFNVLSLLDDGVSADLKCSACNLGTSRKLKTNCMEGVGPSNARVMFVGYAPGKEDDKIGHPMTGPNGKLFYELLAEAEIDASKVWITNCLKCSPYEEEPKSVHWKQCKGHFEAELRRIKPFIIVAVGSQALHFLTGHSGLKELRRHGLPCVVDKKYLVFPVQQPAALFHASGAVKYSLRAEMISDLKWLKAMIDSGKISQETDEPADYKMARNLLEVEEIIEEIMAFDGEICCDLETHGLFPDLVNKKQHIAAVGFSTGPKHARAIPYQVAGIATPNFWTEKELQLVKSRIVKVLRNNTVYGHNFLQFDQKWIRAIFGIDFCNVKFDTMLAHYMLDEEKGTHDLEHLSAQFAGMIPWKRDFNLEDPVQLCKYLCKDVDATSRVRVALEEKLNSFPKIRKLFDDLIVPLAHQLMDMEYRGVRIDLDALNKFDELVTRDAAVHYDAMRAMPAVQAFELERNTQLNVQSPKHLSDIMENFLRLPCIAQTPTGGYSTNAAVLEHYADNPFIKHLQSVRSLQKLKGTYCDGMRARIKSDGRIHTNFLIHGTVTGRLSSQDPNLQNIPRESTAGAVLSDGNLTKQIFAAFSSDYVLIQFDYSQIEYRVLAALSGDKAMIEAFIKGQDFHQATAAKLCNVSYEQVTKAQRNSAKNINFGIVYGMTLASLKYKFVASGSTEADAEEFYNLHQKMFPQAWDYLAAQEKQIREHMYQEYWSGRRRRYSYIDDHVIRQGYNSPVQGGASEITEYGIVRCGKALREGRFDAWPILTVHDSIVFESHIDQVWETAATCKQILENPGFPELASVPIKVDCEIGFNWGDMHPADVENREIRKK